jgi:hypothetical protein
MGLMCKKKVNSRAPQKGGSPKKTKNSKHTIVAQRNMKAARAVLLVVLLAFIGAALSESLARGWGDGIFVRVYYFSIHAIITSPLSKTLSNLVQSSILYSLYDHTLISVVEISWHTLDDARTLSRENAKPVMVIIHKSWCGACKRLKPDFAASSDILKLSSNFIMVQFNEWGGECWVTTFIKTHVSKG